MQFSMNKPICCILDLYAASLQQYAAGMVFLGIRIIIALPNYRISRIMIFSPFDAIFNEKNHMLLFWHVCSKYAAACSSRGFFGVFSVIVAFFDTDVLNHEFVSIQYNFWWKKTICSVLACMQQICCRMQQHWFFWVYLKMIVSFFHKLS